MYQDVQEYYNQTRVIANTNIAENIVELRYQAEEAFLKALLAGNDDALIPLYQTYRQYRLMPRSPDPLRNYKPQLMVLNTLMHKTVQDACVHSLHIDNFSMQMAVQIENGEDLRQLKLLEFTMVQKYCSRLRHSFVIQACMDYIFTTLINLRLPSWRKERLLRKIISLDYSKKKSA